MYFCHILRPLLNSLGTSALKYFDTRNQWYPGRSICQVIQHVSSLVDLDTQFHMIFPYILCLLDPSSKFQEVNFLQIRSGVQILISILLIHCSSSTEGTFWSFLDYQNKTETLIWLSAVPSSWRRVNGGKTSD